MRNMKAVYMVGTDANAPRLEFAEAVSGASELLNFDGRPRADVWPKPAPQVRAESLPESLHVFFRFAPGALVVREDVLGVCEDFKWVSCEGSEPLLIRQGEIRFEVINIVDFLSPPRPGTPGAPPCPVDSHYKALFRIRGRPERQLFCVSGVGNPMNEFKGVYDEYGFTGLRFTEIWRGE
jgi:hypothetical protein